MIRFDALALAAMMASACAGTAFASDLPPEIKMPEVSVKDAQGWYVRGDFGYAINAGHGDTSFRTFDPADGDYSSGRFDSDRFSDDFSGGLGVGYQFNDLFRADLTGDYFSGDYEGRTSSASPCSGSAGGTGCSTKARSSFKAGSLMVNGYVDLGTLAGFTPYVGAGLRSDQDFLEQRQCRRLLCRRLFQLWWQQLGQHPLSRRQRLAFHLRLDGRRCL